MLKLHMFESSIDAQGWQLPLQKPACCIKMECQNAQQKMANRTHFVPRYIHPPAQGGQSVHHPHHKHIAVKTRIQNRENQQFLNSSQGKAQLLGMITTHI